MAPLPGRVAAALRRAFAASPASDDVEPLPAPEAGVAALAERFGLSAYARDVLDVCVAVDREPAVAVALGALIGRDDVRGVTEVAARRLFGWGPADRLDGDPALRWGILRRVPAGDVALVTADPWALARVAGASVLDPLVAARGRVLRGAAPLPGWPVDETVARLRALLDEEGPAVRLVVLGAPGAGRKTFAATVLAACGMPLLAVDLGDLEPGAWPGTWRAVQREAWAAGAAIGWVGGGEAPEIRSVTGRWGYDPGDVPLAPVQVLACPPNLRPPPVPHARDLVVALPALDLAGRVAAWTRLVTGAATWPEAALVEVAARHRVVPGDLVALAAAGPVDAASASAALRARTRERLDGLVEHVPSTFGWDDLVLSDVALRVLREVAAEAAAAPRLWEDPRAAALFPYGRAQLVLLSGPPGTGKTMAAQVLAHAVGLDLFRIDLSTVVSKYVGETSRNLARVLDGVRDLDAVLFFDEADALLGRRTEVKDAHDRYANTDTSHLLQALETWPGLAVLATNRKANLDPAYFRRFRAVIELGRPGPVERARLWERCVTGLWGDEAAALRPLLARLAEEVDLTGAQIKSAVLTGTLHARARGGGIAARDLVRGVERELDKEGKGLPPRDRRRITEGIPGCGEDT